MSVAWKRLLPLTLSLALLALNPGWRAQAQTKGSTTQSAKAAEGKKVGFSGDPARKRGLEIGFDLGHKDGKADKEQNLKPDPKRHEGFQQPEKSFRHEYGSQAAFVSGFRSGYLGGYQTAFGKKISLPNEPGMVGERLKTPGTPTTKRPSASSSSDAL